MDTLKMLAVVTETDMCADGNPETGLQLSELTHIYHCAEEEGCGIIIAGPKGGNAPADPESLKLIVLDEPSKEYRDDPEPRDELRHAKSSDEVVRELFDCVHLVGGHSTMYDFPNSTTLQTIIKEHHEHTKIVAAICHGINGLLNVKSFDGEYLIRDKRLTGFSWFEESVAKRKKEVSFDLEAELKKRGVDYEKALILTTSRVVADRNLITGENPLSPKEVAEVVMQQLKWEKWFDRVRMNLEEVLNYRCFVRVFDREKQSDPEEVRHCLELTTLTPNSSDMQLRESYQAMQPELLVKISKACLDQTATLTASEIVVSATRRDLYRSRARFVLDSERGNVR